MFHMSDQKLVIYNKDDHVDEVLNRRYVGISRFITYLQSRTYKPRRLGFAIERITYVPYSLGEAYYLRVFLNIIKCPISFEDIRTVKEVFCPIFKDACYVLGLSDDDTKYIKETSIRVT